MIRKLRIKFIIINMFLISIVLIIVFASICSFSYRKLKSESYDAMARVLQHNGGGPFPSKPDIGNKKPQKFEPMLPIFYVTADSAGTVTGIFAENVQVSDKTAQEAALSALSCKTSSGVLPDMGLRYLIQIRPGGLKIAFADIGSERSYMLNLVITLFFVGICSIAAFFIISLYLSGWALKPVNKSWEQQRQFVADASHELKTPITVILANTDILMSHACDTVESQMKWVDYIRTEASRMKELINDLLFLAKSDASQHTLTSLPEINLSDLAWSCILPFEPLAYENKISLDCEITPEIRIYADEMQMKQLIAILTDNACKYSESGGKVTVIIDKYQDKIKLSVNNTGQIIPQENLSHIFERFYRSDPARSRECGGYGLGLSIAKSIVENHKGKIWAESSEESGTTFHVLLPLK